MDPMWETANQYPPNLTFLIHGIYFDCPCGSVWVLVTLGTAVLITVVVIQSGRVDVRNTISL